jgi:hypothetical protein
MRTSRLLLLALILTFVAGPVPAADAPKQGLTVHEWGVISVYNDVELANAAMRAEWANMPKFINGQIDGRKVPEYMGPVDAPVIYFHAAQPMTFSVKVDFPKGKPALWWPSTVNYGGGLRKIRPIEAVNSLSWQVHLKAKEAAQVQPMALPKAHWFEALRAVQADDVYINQPYAAGKQKERFIYYDGLLPSPKAAVVTVTGDNVGVKSQAKYPLHDVTVVDLRNIRKVRIARVAKLDAGAEVKEVAFTEADQSKWPFDAVAMLVKQLQTSGLHEDEAKALANVWQKTFFETEGVGVFYRLPQEIYDQLLPLTLSVKPEKIVRTMLVHHPHCEPDLAERVMKLVKQLDAPKFEDRIEAQKRLQNLGRAAFVHLRRARDNKPPLEVRMRLEKILEEFEAEAGLPK